MYDEKTCTSEEAAWLVVGKSFMGTKLALFEAHLTEDQDSPNGLAWYFASYTKDESGGWSEYDGGMYWDYENATDLESVIGETVPFVEFETKEIAYADFEAICFEGDREVEEHISTLAQEISSEDSPPKKDFFVKITETRERIVPVNAESREEARILVRNDYIFGNKNRLSDRDSSEVKFKVVSGERSIKRQGERGR